MQGIAEQEKTAPTTADRAQIHTKGLWELMKSGRITEEQYIARLVAERIEMSEQIEELRYDPLLEDFLSRRPFYQHLNEVIQSINHNPEPREPNRPFQGAVLLRFDLDDFKKANDESGGGHDFGDKVLQHVGKIIREHARRSKDFYGRPVTEQDQELIQADTKEAATTGRPGGDEIDVLLYDTNRSGATKVAEAIRLGLIDHPLKTPSGQSWYQTVSTGIALIEPGLTSAEVIKRADAAAYWAKKTGKNRTVIWREEMDKEPIILEHKLHS